MLLLHVSNARAQVDWSDLFPGEGSKPAAPQPRLAEPPAPTIRSLARVQGPSPANVASPKAALAKTSKQAKAKPSRRIVQSRPEDEPEFPAAADVPPPHFDRQSTQHYRPEPSVDEAQEAVGRGPTWSVSV